MTVQLRKSDAGLDGFIESLVRLLGVQSVRTGGDISMLDPGEHPQNLGAVAVVFPSSTEQVSALVKLCRTHGISIVPHGGRTGLVGGGVSGDRQIVLSMTRMSRAPEIDPVSTIATVEAGVTLEVLQNAAAEFGLQPGIDLAARGSATLGGMASTNAGGISAFHHGVMRHRILGLEAVLPDGEIYSDMSGVLKNNTGYDLKHLLIGAEGTLGVITRLVIRLEAIPASRLTAIFALPATAVALELVALARSRVRVGAAEVVWSTYFRFTSGLLGWSASDYDMDAPVHVLLSLNGETEDTVQTAMLALYEAMLERHPSITAMIPQSLAQENAVWAVREDTSLIYRHYPGAPSYDVSVPARHIDAYLQETMSALAAIEPDMRPFVFGHLADGNLHIVVNRPGSWLDEDMRERLDGAIYSGLSERNGSFSAEHGIGSKRLAAMRSMAPHGKLPLMRLIKQALDPDRIMNPGKVVETSEN